ncbi:MAG: DUF4921 family protein [Propionibacterium sp.]|nr:DUF4921 family protein [Propionibacterium sp.]
MQPHLREPEYLRVLPDGTLKQLNPFTGTEVWTVPGRGHRPIEVRTDDRPIDPVDVGAHCAFCERNYLATPPEKSRVVRADGGWERREATPASALFDTVAEFRRVPNLFEILSYHYWHVNHSFEPPARIRAQRDAYLAEPEGLVHVLEIAGTKLRAAGMPGDEVEALSTAERLEAASGFFGGGHDVVIARRHFVDGATSTSQLASSGTLSREEHAQFMAFTVDSVRDLYDANHFARYVVVFQNWLKPAGASFDHLHKQLVAIDERGAQQEAALARVLENPNIFNEAGPNYAAEQGLVIADNEHAVAFAGYGHRYPTIEIYSKSAHSSPWEHSADEVEAMSDMVHAMHAATGPDVPSNEEWHYRPIDLTAPMPWRIMLKWRISTLAGFEGATKIYLNTITPSSIRERVVQQLQTLRGIGHVARDLRIGDEVDLPRDPLHYCR